MMNSMLIEACKCKKGWRNSRGDAGCRLNGTVRALNTAVGLDRTLLHSLYYLLPYTTHKLVRALLSVSYIAVSHYITLSTSLLHQNGIDFMYPFIRLSLLLHVIDYILCMTIIIWFTLKVVISQSLGHFLLCDIYWIWGNVKFILQMKNVNVYIENK